MSSCTTSVLFSLFRNIVLSIMHVCNSVDHLSLLGPLDINLLIGSLPSMIF